MRYKIYELLRRYSIFCLISRHIIYFLKLFNIEKPDHRRGKILEVIYLLRNTEWKYYTCNKEVSSSDYTFDHSTIMNYKYKSVSLSTDDLPWLLGYNRNFIEQSCNGKWYLIGNRYFFQYEEDLKIFKKNNNG